MYDPIRIGMIGAGHIAGSHAACWQNEAVITAVCSRQRSKAEQLARKFDIPVVCDDIPSLLNRDDVDAVGITTPPHLHHPIAMQAMQAGKHVFCEKPLALTGDEARQMVELAEKTGVTTGVQSGMRHFKSLRHLRQIIKQGTLGQIFSFHGAWSFDWAKDPKFRPVFTEWFKLVTKGETGMRTFIQMIPTGGAALVLPVTAAGEGRA